MHLLQRWTFIPKRLIKLVVPVVTVFILSLGLTFTFVLYHLPRPPLHHLAWQKWELASTVHSSEPASDLPVGKEWWELPELDAGDAPAGVSLPLDVWSPLLPHATGLTEIAIQSCLVNPDLVDFCSPKTTPEEDALKGRWVRVEKDLNVKSGVWWNAIYYRRTRRLDIPLITSIHLLPANGSISDLPGSEHSWIAAAGDLHDGVHPSEPKLRLYYQIKKPLAGIPKWVELEELVTEIDVQYGRADYLPWGFQRTNMPAVSGTEGTNARPAVWVTFRKGMSRPTRAPPLHFSDNGTFKILQVADLHYSVSDGDCRDVDPDSLPSFLSAGLDSKPCRGDVLTSTLLTRTLSLEKPSLVVFTGDQLNGQTTSWDSTSVLLKAIAQVVEAKIPWAMVFGNHDAESTDMSKSEQMQVLTRLPYAVRDMEEGPQWVDGVGNWVAQVKSADPSATNILTLYFLDSHAYTKSGWTFWKPADYDWIKQSQIDWYKEQSKGIPLIERPFTPDGAKDLGQVWTREDALRQAKEKQLAKPNAVMFFHIPLPETFASAADVSASGESLAFGQDFNEGGAPKKNSGFFENGLRSAFESEQGGPAEVKVVANGHCHITDQCKRVKGIWLCFGGGSSFSGYGKIGFDRRFRVYEVSDYGETIRTYKRTQDGSMVDDMVLVGKGAKGSL